MSQNHVRLDSNGCTDNPKTLPWLKELVQDTSNDKLRNAAIEVLSEHFLSDPETYKLLSDIARHEPDEKIRLNTFCTLTKHAEQTNSNRPDKLEILSDISLEVPEVSIDCDSDYIKLRDLLKAQRWKQAQSETYHLILRKLGQKAGSLIRLENDSCGD